MAGVGGGGQVGKHWSSTGVGGGGLCPFLVASAEFYYCAPEDKEIKPGVLSGGEKNLPVLEFSEPTVFLHSKRHF